MLHQSTFKIQAKDIIMKDLLFESNRCLDCIDVITCQRKLRLLLSIQKTLEAKIV